MHNLDKRRTEYRESSRRGPTSTAKVNAWKAKNRTRWLVQHSIAQQRRRAYLFGAEGSHTKAEWEAILVAQDYRCVDCGAKTKLDKDHIVPLSRGGSNRAENLAGRCRSCNSRKGDRIVGPLSNATTNGGLV